MTFQGAMKHKKAAANQGFSLIELLLAAAVLMTGLLGVAALLGVALQSNVLSKNTTSAVTLAQAKLEELKSNNTTTNVKLVVGGSLESNVTNHHAVTSGYTARWVVTSVSAKAREVTVRIIPNATNNQTKTVELKTILRLK